ncbi:MAG: hypothetical protein IGR93_19655 [Hydrococcus sp. C42_A2020_068]|uniref:hypothetical protein n=1 Tax=Pleurocapsa sp. PCC 7327 TaxID=118163 RepID=UPI00029FB90D|nr:hypothetical protein [Pleurocapsa sp. PCC 7327]AFY77487.1 hypothetical protein Ple7327_2165 [Pleurocapsa sp. PCC 7327]MBF2022243.1 hypothetical protein [Hydrococcus sp. C42_A2020_068]
MQIAWRSQRVTLSQAVIQVNPEKLEKGTELFKASEKSQQIGIVFFQRRHPKYL